MKRSETDNIITHFAEFDMLISYLKENTDLLQDVYKAWAKDNKLQQNEVLNSTMISLWEEKCLEDTENQFTAMRDDIQDCLNYFNSLNIYAYTTDSNRVYVDFCADGENICVELSREEIEERAELYRMENE